MITAGASTTPARSALMMTIQWTPEAIRALGATTDLPTLGEIFGLSTWRSREMAKTGEWEQAGIRILKMGSRYRVTVPSILDVLGVPGDDGTPADGETPRADGTPRDGTSDGQDSGTVPLAQADGHADSTAASPPAPEAALPAHELPARNGHLRPTTIRPPAPAGAPHP
jgi:hypothetical protein